MTEMLMITSNILYILTIFKRNCIRLDNIWKKLYNYYGDDYSTTQINRKRNRK